MAFINFPNSPSDGDTFTSNGVTFTYSTSKGRWSAGSAGSLITTEGVQDITGAMFTGNTETGITATYEDSDGTIDLAVSASTPTATILADMAALIALTGMSIGQTALVSALNKVFMYTSSGWYLIATMTNASPTSITGVAGTYTLAIDGTPTVVTVASTDPEGFPLTFSYAVTTGSLGSTATVAQGSGANANVFTITPSTVESNAGTFSLTFSVTDGAGAVSVVSAFSLVFFQKAITSVSGMATSGTSGTWDYWYTSTSATSNADNYIELTVVPGQTFYIGMIGASGSGAGSINPSNVGAEGGPGGYAAASILVPSGVTKMTVWTGAGGNVRLGNASPSTAGSNISTAGGVQGGGRSGVGHGSSYQVLSGASGGGLVGLFEGAYTTTRTISNVHLMVGSGGGGGAYASSQGDGGFGGVPNDESGGFGGWDRRVGTGTTSGTAYYTHGGSGGTVSAGGAKAALIQANSTYRYSGTNGASFPQATDGGALTGGAGGDSSYDPGAGGGAGYYGGGGGVGGGGWSYGAGGGGSGYMKSGVGHNINTTYTKAGDDYSGNGQPYVAAYAHAIIGTSGLFSSTNHGKKGLWKEDGNAGYAIIMCENQ